MTPDFANGGGYLIHVDESNSSVYVRLLPNDVIRTDDENPYYFFYEMQNDKTVRFTHPVSQSGASGCGAGNCAIFFTDHPISISIDGVKYYYLYDGLGSVTELIDASENVVNIYRYSPLSMATEKSPKTANENSPL